MEAIPIGFDFNAVNVVRKAARVKNTAWFWQQIKVAESEILDIYKERKG